MFDLDEPRVRLVQAPMAGGPATVALAGAVCSGGGIGFLAGGYLRADQLGERIEALRAQVDGPFGVNVFVPQPAPPVEAVAAYRAELQAEAERYGVSLPEPDPTDDDGWDDKIELLIRRPVPLVSFTFGAPPREVVDQLHRVDTAVAVTVTGPAEARVAAERGADALVVQGPGAGGHAGIHDQGGEGPTTPLPKLLGEVAAVTALPLIAAGGLSTGGDIAAVLRAGARAAQLGTVYLRTPEAGTNPVHRAALADPRFTETVVTRAFSGRPARGLRNRFIDEHDATAPVGYPLVNQLTKPLRAAAAKAGDAEGLHLWAGTGYRNSSTLPAGELTRRLWEDAQAQR